MSQLGIVYALLGAAVLQDRQLQELYQKTQANLRKF